MAIRPWNAGRKPRKTMTRYGRPKPHKFYYVMYDHQGYVVQGCSRKTTLGTARSCVIMKYEITPASVAAWKRHRIRMRKAK
jgi:hypothetical protein